MVSFRRYWFRYGLVLGLLLVAFMAIYHTHLSGFRVLLCISLVTLFLHQFEEYQFPGYFPRMINTAMFGSKSPDRYPLNANTAWLINVWIGWGLYALAIVFGEHAVWLATASILVSIGNVVAHTFLFNIRARTYYNPGMLTAICLFLTLSVYYFVFIASHGLLHPDTLLGGLILGVVINYFGIFKLITLLANKKTRYAFRPFH